MSGDRRDEWIVVTEDAKTLPIIEVLTGRGFITGKSGSGKSNTAGVVAEELLESGYNLLIVDTEGEYFGLKEEYELLHVGADDYADVEVDVDQAESIAEIAIKKNMPVVLDVSGYFSAEEARELITAVLKHVYHLEQEARKPFLIMVEEMQEYLPQRGGGTELAELLERIAKRGRKRGLGICGMSQRPSSVDKDFITQCDWMVWHRLTWDTDLNVVRNILGSERANSIQDFDAGEAILMTDWDDTVERVQFKRKRTHDAGATPGLEQYERPDLTTVGGELLNELEAAGASVESESSEDPPESVQAEPVEQSVEAPEDMAADIDLDAADSDELRERLAEERRKNEVLTAEIQELRSILRGVKGEETAPTVAESPTAPKPDLKPPRPPRRPPNRDGVGGNMVEFAQLMIYLLRTAWYRVRVRYHYR